jgi:hypothetical protein
VNFEKDGEPHQIIHIRFTDGSANYNLIKCISVIEQAQHISYIACIPTSNILIEKQKEKQKTGLKLNGFAFYTVQKCNCFLYCPGKI